MIEDLQPGEQEGVCDACSCRGICRTDGDGDAYICRACRAFHDRAIDAAARVLWNGVHIHGRDRDWEAWLNVYGGSSKYHLQASAAVKAYLEYNDE